MTWRGAALLILLALVGRGAAAAEEPLGTDLSTRVIALTAGFTGANIILFGTREQPGDIVVAVHGPPGEAEVRRKHRLLGIWVNTETLIFDDVPAYYALASSRPLDEIAPPEVLETHRIGIANLMPYVRRQTDTAVTAQQEQEFEQALLREQEKSGRYIPNIGRVALLGEHLFRVDIPIPAVIPVGTYAVETYLLRDGKIVAQQTVPLRVIETGVGAGVSDFAHNEALAYGIIAAAAAAMAGWLASLAFRGY